MPLRLLPRFFAAFSFCCISLVMHAHAANNDLPIIPKPSQQQLSQGSFKLSASTRIVASDEAAKLNAGLLNTSLEKLFGFKLKIENGKAKNGKNQIVFSTEKTDPADQLKNEQYSLNIAPQSIQVTGTGQGQFYALQSLLQLLPLERKAQLQLPAVQIKDSPRFVWRGMHLDVSRHMVSTDFIKKFLDQMAFYKMNTFHWHLTDDQGWRIEIKAYPRLTEIGAWRKQTAIGRSNNPDPFTGDGKPYGGYYTQAQIRDIVAYAAARHITVVPEIEMPGHAQAALAAYPELACTPGPFEVASNWGVFEDIFCPSEATFQFLEKVLAEVADLFPGPYLHVGGDEVPKTRWKKSPLAQAVMQREGLKNEEELQSWFIRRAEKIVNGKGKRLIGWDEILEGGLAPNATVMSWRGEEGGIASARQGHDVIMSPEGCCYFDAGQGPKDQEAWQLEGKLTLEKVYAFNPVPAVLTVEQQKFIRGVQANTWTEYLPGTEMIEYMVFPRMLAMAEIAWSVQQGRQFANFEQRLSSHYQHLSRAGIGYRLPRPTGLPAEIITPAKNYLLKLQAPVPDSRLYYTLDGSTPDEKSAQYHQPVEISLRPDTVTRVQVLTIASDGRRSVVQAATLRQQSGAARM